MKERKRERASERETEGEEEGMCDLDVKQYMNYIFSKLMTCVSDGI